MRSGVIAPFVFKKILRSIPPLTPSCVECSRRGNSAWSCFNVNLHVNRVSLYQHRNYAATYAKFDFDYYTAGLSQKALKKIKTMPRGNLVMTKVDGPNFQSLFSEGLKTLIELFSKHGYEIRLAGGPVRDLLSGIKPADLDFATTATPNEMKAMFEQEGIRMVNTNGEKHGTITARICEENFEVTTLRIDVSTDGRHAEVEFTKSWELDAGRRDLTVNSMFLDFEGNVYDYFDGRTDLEKRRVVFVGNPVDRICEDYLRILRYFRFYGRIAQDPDSHEKVTMDAIRENAEGLQQVSGERIWVELKKLLNGNFAGELMLSMLDLGVGPYIGIPDGANLEEFKIVYERVKTNRLELNPIALIAALLRDEEGARKIHSRLKLSAFERDLCLFIVQNREKLAGTLENILPISQEMTLLSSITVPVMRSMIDETLKYNGDVKLLESYQSWVCPKFPLRGNEFLERGYRGRTITYLMAELKRRWISSGFQLGRDELVKMITEIKDQMPASPPPQKKSKKQQGTKS